MALAAGSRDLSQAEKEIIVYWGEEVHKLKCIFTQNGPRLSFWVQIVVSLWINSALQAVISFSTWDKSHDSGANTQKLEDM